MRITTRVLLISSILILWSKVVPANEIPQLHYKDIVEQNAGQVVYLDFWASWCTPCRKSFPWMNEMQMKYGDKNFKVISINVDSDRKLAQKFLANTPANFSILYDPAGSLASEMKLKGMPSSYIINAEGKLVSTHVGFSDKKKSLYEQEIKQLIQGN